MKRAIPTVLFTLISFHAFADATVAPASQPAGPAGGIKLPGVNVPNPPASQPAVRGISPVIGGQVMTAERWIENNRRSMEAIKKSVTMNPPQKIDEITDCFSFWNAGEWIDASINFDIVPHGRQIQFQVGPDQSLWSASSFTYNTGDGQTRTQRSISHYNFDNSDFGHFYQSTIITTESTLLLTGQGIGLRITLSENLNMARLSVYGVKDDRYQSICQLNAASFRELELQHPMEVRQYLSPLLSDLGNKQFFTPGATDIYLAFDELKPSEEAVEKVKSLLPKLDDDAFEIRDAAANEIIALGDKGIAALVHLDRSNLSDEQNDRLDFILSRKRRSGVHDSQALRHNGIFLVDCLTHPDEQVRKLAAADLEKILNRKPISIDLTQSSDKVCEALRVLREEVQAAASASTAK